MPSKNPPALLPNPQIIKQLVDAGLPAESLTEILIEYQEGKQQFAMVNSVMGGTCFIVVVITFYLLIEHGHDIAAGSLLGVEVLAIIRMMLGNRI